MKRLALGAMLLVATAATLLAGAFAPGDAEGQPLATVSVQLLSFNDYHGNLEPPTGSSGRIGTTDAGGIEYFATHLANLKATNPNTLVVGAGDMIGASPLTSALFHDEPSIESLNLAGLQVTSVGNHEFDEGSAELLRMQNGGCHPKDGCQDGTPFAGADFEFLSANVFLDKSFDAKITAASDKAKTEQPGKPDANAKATTAPLLPAYTIKTVGGVKVGFIGMTLEGTPTIVTPTGVAGLTFYPEAYMANYWAQNLRKQGVKTIVVLLHEGGFQTGGSDINGCAGIAGPIVGITNLMSNDIDVVVSGHTHNAYNCMIGSKLVTSAASFGRLITDIDLEIDTTTGDVVTKRATNRIVTRTVPKHAGETALLERYQRLAAPLANRVIGRITADISRTANRAGESALGDVIADAQLAATKPANKGGAVVAFMNPGGIRADFTFNQQSGGEQPGQVTFAEAFTVQPFGNTLVVKTMTGQMIKDLLEQQFDNPSTGADRVLQVSSGFTYTYRRSNPKGSRVDAASIRIDGTPIGLATQYRVSMNSFLADGGDNFPAFRQGTNTLGGEVDTDAIVSYFAANNSAPIGPGPQTRIVRAD
ncbi:MAG: bifunctional metallophosphatase/5'-nucleotidase [Actinobacteria bacterium]|nr:bifunctional metallophosphatase/5'-nucleotidase [Actinomycetota bacterium]